MTDTIFSRLSWEKMLVREFREVVVTDHVHFVPVITHEAAQVFEAHPALGIVVSTLGGEERDGMIVCRQTSGKRPWGTSGPRAFRN